MSGVSSPRTGHGLPVSFRVSANISSMAAMRSLKSALRLAGMGSALLDAAVFVSFCRPQAIGAVHHVYLSGLEVYVPHV